MQDSNNKQGGQNGVTEKMTFTERSKEKNHVDMQGKKFPCRGNWMQRTQGGSLPGKSEEDLAARVAAVDWRRGHQEEVKSEGLEEV